MAIQSALACSEAKDDGLLVSRQLMERVLVWVVSFSLAVEDGFLFIMDKSFDFSVGQMRWGLLFFPSFFCELICHFISPNAGVCWHPNSTYNTQTFFPVKGERVQQPDLPQKKTKLVCHAHQTSSEDGELRDITGDDLLLGEVVAVSLEVDDDLGAPLDSLCL